MSVYFCECGEHIDRGSNTVIHHLAGHYGQMRSLVHALRHLHRSDGHTHEPLCSGCTNVWPCDTHKMLTMLGDTA